MIRRLLIAALAVVALGAADASAQSKKKGPVSTDGDVLFGFAAVGLVSDRDVIRVGTEIGKFERIRLRVRDNDIYFNELKVVYIDDTVSDVAVAEEIKADTRTKWFPIKSDKFIKEIQMSYRSKPSSKGQARIEVYGDYAPGWLGAKGEGARYNQGWVLLGADVAGFVGFETRAFSIGKNEGGFRNIRVTARNRSITLRNVTVTYADGKTDSKTMRERVDADKSYGPIDLKGKVAAIKEVSATYRSRFFSGGTGNARVEIWGQH